MSLNEAVYNRLTEQIIKCCINVHKELGPGLMESIYEICLIEELEMDGFKVESQVEVPVYFKGKKLNKIFIIDLLIEGSIILELKSVASILPVHEAQLVSYLKISNKKLGLLINFNVPLLINGIRRRVNGNLNE